MRFTAFLSLCLALSMIFVPVISIGEKKEVSASSAKVEFKSEKKEQEEKISVYLSKSKENVTLSMRDYLVGVVSAEISPLYSDEAIKAQVIASHTYALYKQKKGETITDDYKKHQSYISPEEAKEKWGDKYEIYSKKITSIVDEVKDKVITYDGEIILPAFFALCSGKTENSEDVWGGKRPYLVSVTSAGDKLAPELITEKTFSAEEFKTIIEKAGSFTLSENKENWIQGLTSTPAGAVKTLTIEQKSFKGNDIQSAFNLKSNNFTLKYSGGSFVFTVAGNGHGVGMSQYGADFMARQGSNYEEILKHYYQGTEISTL